MATFLLVHGAWHGGWCWKPTEDNLRRYGHQTHSPTHTGLGERSHLAHPDITPNSHVEDILGVVRWRELDDIILVGHSHGGLIIAGVASKLPDRIRKLVYLDAFAAEESEVSLFAKTNPERLARFETQTRDGGFLVEPDMFDAWTDDPDKRRCLETMCTPHPIGCFQNDVTLSARQNEVGERHYIICDRNYPSPFHAEYRRVSKLDGWTTHHIDSKHDAMVERPEDLAAILHRISETKAQP